MKVEVDPYNKTILLRAENSEDRLVLNSAYKWKVLHQANTGWKCDLPGVSTILFGEGLLGSLKRSWFKRIILKIKRILNHED